MPLKFTKLLENNIIEKSLLTLLRKNIYYIHVWCLYFKIYNSWIL